jgi:hypothetical protein
VIITRAMAKNRRANHTHKQRTNGHESALIAHLQGEIAYLRAELAKRAEELARERERGDVLHREALARIDALASGSGSGRPPDELHGTLPMEPANSDSDRGGVAVEMVAAEPIHRAWDELTDVLIAELGMEPQAAWIAAAQELGIAHGGRITRVTRPIP